MMALPTGTLVEPGDATQPRHRLGWKASKFRERVRRNFSRGDSRIEALDLARGLAVLGMIGAHVAVTRSLSWTDPGSWLAVVHGRSSILFATLAGISLAIMTGRHEPKTGPAMTTAKVRILLRACILFGVGGLLTALGSGVEVILQVYAALFVVAVPFLHWSPRRLLLVAAGWGVVSPTLTLWLAAHLPSTGTDSAQITDLFVTGIYPGLVWIIFVLVGLAIGRSDLGRYTVQARLAVSGVAMAIVGYGSGWIASRIFSDGSAFGDWKAYKKSAVGAGADWADKSWRGFDFRRSFDLGSLTTAEPHSGTTFEIVGSLGVAIGLIGGLCLVARYLRAVAFPLAAVGSMALTVYAGHVVAIWMLGDRIQEQNDNTIYVWFVLIVLVVAPIWLLFLGRGPLERVVTWATKKAAKD